MDSVFWEGFRAMLVCSQSGAYSQWPGTFSSTQSSIRWLCVPVSPPKHCRSTVCFPCSAQELVFGYVSLPFQQRTASFRSWCPHFLPQQKVVELSRVPLQVTSTAESHLPCWAGKLCHLLGEGTALCEHVPFIPTVVHVAISHRSPVWTTLALGEARQRQSPTRPFWI